MDKWIRDLINSVTSGLTTLINAVADRIGWVYNVFIGVFIKVRKAFDGAVNGIRAKLIALGSLAGEVYVTLRWLVFIRIPQVVTNAVNAATNYVMQQVIYVRDFLKGLIDGVASFVWQQIGRIDSFIDQIIDWAARKFNEVIDTLRRVATIVGTLLTDPRRLAAWVIDALIGEVLLWVDRNADRLFLLVRNRSVHYTLQAAARIEQMITRLL